MLRKNYFFNFRISAEPFDYHLGSMVKVSRRKRCCSYVFSLDFYEAQLVLKFELFLEHVGCHLDLDYSVCSDVLILDIYVSYRRML